MISIKYLCEQVNADNLMVHIMKRANWCFTYLSISS